ncbi:MAG: zf-HC2 domain-containing protein [Gemmatimonadota bacterium]
MRNPFRRSRGKPPKIGCEEALSSLYEYIDHELPPEEEARVREHLEICRNCYPHYNFERLFLEYVQKAGRKTEGSGELRERIRGLIDRMD